jgi:hypothetical protein
MAKSQGDLIYEIHQQIGVVASVIKRHDKTLYGNGRPGLCEVVSDLTRTVAELKVELDSHKDASEKSEDDKEKISTRLLAYASLAGMVVLIIFEAIEKFG